MVEVMLHAMSRQSGYVASIRRRRAELAGRFWDLSKTPLSGREPRRGTRGAAPQGSWPAWSTMAVCNRAPPPTWPCSPQVVMALLTTALPASAGAARGWPKRLTCHAAVSPACSPPHRSALPAARARHCTASARRVAAWYGGERRAWPGPGCARMAKALGPTPRAAELDHDQVEAVVDFSSALEMAGQLPGSSTRPGSCRSVHRPLPATLARFTAAAWRCGVQGAVRASALGGAPRRRGGPKDLDGQPSAGCCSAALLLPAVSHCPRQ